MRARTTPVRVEMIGGGGSKGGHKSHSHPGVAARNWWMAWIGMDGMAEQTAADLELLCGQLPCIDFLAG